MANPFLIETVYAVPHEVQGPEYFWDNRRRKPKLYEGRSHVLQLCREGTAFIEVEGKRHLSTPDTAMIFRHGEDSAYGNALDAPYTNAWLAFSGEPMTGIYDFLRDQHGPVIPLPDGTESRERFNDLIGRRQASAFNSPFHESALCQTFFMRLLDQLREAVHRTDPIVRARDLLREQFSLPISVKTIADEAGLSREYFSRAFTERYHQSPSSYLKELRFAQADRLLTTTELPLEAIARDCGYTDTSAFVRAYRRAKGKSPRKQTSSES